MKAIVLALAKVILGVGVGTVAFGFLGSYARIDGLLDCYLLLVGVLLYPVMTLAPRRPAAVRVRRQALHHRLPQLPATDPQRRRDSRRKLRLPTVHAPLIAAPHRRLDHQPAVTGQ